MGVDEREGGIVADGADVAEVVGEAFQLAHQRAQIDGARRRLEAKRRFHGAGEGDGVGHRAVARHAAGELRRLVQRGAEHQAVYALVHVAQPLLQAHHGLAVAAEAEVTGLDDAGVHGADRDLVQRRADGREERVSIAGGGCRLLRAERRAHAPAAVVEPAARVRRPLGLETVKIADRPLQAQGRRVRDADGWIAPLRAGQADDQQLGLRLGMQRQMHRLAVAPQAEQRRFAGGDPQHRLPPGIRIHHDARPRPMRGNAAAPVRQCREEGHGAAILLSHIARRSPVILFAVARYAREAPFSPWGEGARRAGCSPSARRADEGALATAR